MSIGKWVLAAAVVGGGAHAWQVHQHAVLHKKLQASADSYGFVPVLLANGAPKNTAVILAALNCPSAQAKRADAMASRLSELGIPNARANSYMVGGVRQDQAALVEQTSAVLGGEIPVVIVNGMAKANPTIDEVVSEYQRGI
jgi:hypothetical protein